MIFVAFLIFSFLKFRSKLFSVFFVFSLFSLSFPFLFYSLLLPPSSHHTEDPLQSDVVVDPDITVLSLDRENQFLVFASDGLWDVMTNSEAVGFVLRRLQNVDPSDGEKMLGLLKEIVKDLVVYAVDVRHSKDNVSAVIVLLSHSP